MSLTHKYQKYIFNEIILMTWLDLFFKVLGPETCKSGSDCASMCKRVNNMSVCIFACEDYRETCVIGFFRLFACSKIENSILASYRDGTTAWATTTCDATSAADDDDIVTVGHAPPRLSRIPRADDAAVFNRPWPVGTAPIRESHGGDECLQSRPNLKGGDSKPPPRNISVLPILW